MVFAVRLHDMFRRTLIGRRPAAVTDRRGDVQLGVTVPANDGGDCLCFHGMLIELGRVVVSARAVSREPLLSLRHQRSDVVVVSVQFHNAVPDLSGCDYSA